MQNEIRKCQNCNRNFEIVSEDFEFYEKIKVSPPTFCSECRMIRRKIFRNERALYKRACKLCGQNIISVYSKEQKFSVYCNECWFSDKWEPLDFGVDLDFSKTFLGQIKELSDKVPRPALTVLNNVGSPYVNYAWFSKNSYMCFDLGYGENVLYSNNCHFIKDSVDCFFSKNLELCYENINCKECSQSAFLKDCSGCLNSYFLRNCKNCSSCILCENLRNKSYCILNNQYTKEEYERKKAEFVSGHTKIENSKKLFLDRIYGTLFKENDNIQAVNCSGDNIWQSKNCFRSFNVFRSENCRFVENIDSDVKDSMDLTNAAEGELMYCGTSVSGRNLLFDIAVTSSYDVFYSILCLKNNNNLFGCIGLRNKQYCILNKQYTKEEYEKLLPQIMQHMG